MKLRSIYLSLLVLTLHAKSSFAVNPCEPGYTTWDINGISQLATNPNFTECPDVRFPQTPDDLLNGEQGCRCVENRDIKMSCETFKNFNDVIKVNQEEVQKLFVINSTIEEFQTLFSINNHGKTCSLSEQEKSCQFQEGKLSLEDLFKNYKNYISLDVSSFEDINKVFSEPNSQANHAYTLLTYHYLRPTINDLDPRSQKTAFDYFARKLQVDQEIFMQNSGNLAGSKTRDCITNCSIAFAQIFDDSDFDMNKKVIKSIEEQLSSLESNTESDPSIIQSLESIETEIGNASDKIFDEMCESVQKKLVNRCEFLKKMDEGSYDAFIPPLTNFSMIEFIQDKAIEAIRKPVTDEQKELINYSMESFICASNYQNDEDKLLKFVEKSDCVEDINESSIKSYISNGTSEYHQEHLPEDASVIDNLYSQLEEEYQSLGLLPQEDGTYNNSPYSQFERDNLTPSQKSDLSNNTTSESIKSNSTISNAALNPYSGQYGNYSSNTFGNVSNLDDSRDIAASGAKTPIESNDISALMKELEESRRKIKQLEDQLNEKSNSKESKNEIEKIKDEIQKEKSKQKEIAKKIEEKDFSNKTSKSSELPNEQNTQVKGVKGMTGKAATLGTAGSALRSLASRGPQNQFLEKTNSTAYEQYSNSEIKRDPNTKTFENISFLQQKGDIGLLLRNGTLFIILESQGENEKEEWNYTYPNFNLSSLEGLLLSFDESSRPKIEEEILKLLGQKNSDNVARKKDKEDRSPSSLKDETKSRAKVFDLNSIEIGN